jgi:Protein of unknown function (DUF3108)
MNRILVILMLLLPGISMGQDSLRVVRNTAFKPGEFLKYRIHYGIIDAGEATLEVKPEIYTVQNRKCYHVVGLGRTRGAFDWFFKVRDRYETYFDMNAFVPWIFIRRVDEGGYKISQNVNFNPYKKTATSEKATIPVVENVQDLVSAYYYLRTLDFANAKVGATFPIPAYLDDEVYEMEIKYVGKETISTRLGTFKCLMFRPLLQEGRVFKEQEGMTVWVTDDSNRIVVRAEAEILVGSILMDLDGYKGLAGPLTSKVK